LPRPIFFGEDLHLFGWYHPPAGTRQKRIAALICPPVGHEYMCAHRALRNLAYSLAAADIPALRFDYYGMGNSAGSAREPGIVAQWIASIHAAADELRAQSGCDTIALVGLRMGATLGVQAASTRTDIDTLVLWVPCAEGASFVREARLRASAARREADRSADGLDGDLHLSGFHFASANLAELAMVTLRQVDVPHVRSTLLISRADVAADARLSNTLRGQFQRNDAQWAERSMSEYDAFMTSPLSSQLPTPALHEIVDWISERSVENERGDIPAALSGGSSVVVPGTNAAISEEPVTFGHDLFGILTTPVRGSRYAAIMLNTGADHHVGPHRLYVELARKWALNGIAVLRFDLSGLGDSGNPSDKLSADTYPSTAMADVTAAMDFIRDRCSGIEPVLVGVCAGAYHAIHALRQGNCAAIAVNAPLYYRRGDPVDVLPDVALRSWSKWRRLFSRDHSVLEVARMLKFAGQHVIRRILARRDASLFPDGVRAAVVYSGDDPGLRLFGEATGTTLDALGARPGITVDIVAGAGHTFMERDDQQVLAALLTRRLFELQRISPVSLRDLPATSETSYGDARYRPSAGVAQ